jgi:hypothetical protein
MGLFEVLASSNDSGPRAVIAAQTRAKSVFERYVGNDVDKLAFIADDLRKMAAEVAEEYGYDNAEKLFVAAGLALAGGHPAGCECGFCKNKGAFGKDDEEDEGMEKEAAVKTACDCANGEHCGDCECCDGEMKEASVKPYAYAGFDWEHVAAEDDRSGDSYQHERESLPTSDGTGLGDTGAVPTDKSKSGDQTGWNLEPIDVDSQRHQLEHQDAPDRAEYNNEDFDPSSPVRERVDADTPMQPEYTTGPDTQTWSDASTQASPVTSKWSLLA